MPQLTMPKMGDGMEEGTIRRWLKKEGEPVAEQEPLAEIETEKAAIEIPATEAGILTRILVQEGATVPVGTPIAEVNGSGGEAKSSGEANGAAPPAASRPREATTPSVGKEAPAPATPDADLSQRAPEPAPAPPPQAAQPAAPETTGRVKASPLARKVAEEHGIDLRAVQGTGPGGRIIEADVTDAVKQGTPAAAPAAAPQYAPAPAPAAVQPGTERKLSQMRKVIAKRLTESKQTIPHFYLTIEVDMRAAFRLRKEFNNSVEEDRKISFNDLVVRACALALMKHPQVNSRLDGDVIKTPGTVNVGIAVSLEEGLIVPVVRDTQTKSLSVLGQEIRALADRARKGQLKPEDYSGGTFTVSNLGMFDITQFQAVINPPEAAILAVGAIRDVPVVEKDAVVPGKQMSLTLSVDHRVVDGAVAAVFTQTLKKLLESPLSLFG
jgi:pyruvate dehydrogenase E2 component (dihydrolipoamide acetyltransferase)